MKFYHNIFAAILLCLANSVWSQNLTLSPYSRFGLGILENTGTTQHLALGGVTSSYADVYSVNPGNPAANAYLKETTLQMAGRYTLMNLTTDDASANLNSSQINDISLGFKREGKPWAITLGVQPFSYSGYSLESPDTATAPDVRYAYEGQGGFNKAQIGFARYFRLGRNTDSTRFTRHSISLGATADYYFGEIRQVRKAIFDDVTYASARYSNRTGISALSANLGMHYTAPLKVKVIDGKINRAVHLMAGATYTLGGDYGARYSEIGQSFYLFNTSEIPIDTTYYLPEIKGSVTVPDRITLGLATQFTWDYDHTLWVGMEYRTQDWSLMQFNFEGQETQAGNFEAATGISFGIQYRPSTQLDGEFLKSNVYRIGLRQTETYLAIKGTQITQQAISAGFSIPLRASASSSYIHFGIETGVGGTTDNGLIKESFTTFQVGLTLMPHLRNKWFIPRQYE